MVNVGSLGRLHLVLAAPVGVTCSHFMYTPARMRISLVTWPHSGLSFGVTAGCYTSACVFATYLRLYTQAPRSPPLCEVDGDPIHILPGAAGLAPGVLRSPNPPHLPPPPPPAGSGAGPLPPPSLGGYITITLDTNLDVVERRAPWPRSSGGAGCVGRVVS